MAGYDPMVMLQAQQNALRQNALNQVYAQGLLGQSSIGLGNLATTQSISGAADYPSNRKQEYSWRKKSLREELQQETDEWLKDVF